MCNCNPGIKPDCGCYPRLKIETGKSYRTANDKKVRIICTDFVSHTGMKSYGLMRVETNDGRWFEQGITFTPEGKTPSNDPNLRLVCEWKEPVVHRRDVVWYEFFTRETVEVAVANVGEVAFGYRGNTSYKEVHRQTVEYTE